MKLTSFVHVGAALLLTCGVTLASRTNDGNNYVKEDVHCENWDFWACINEVGCYFNFKTDQCSPLPDIAFEEYDCLLKQLDDRELICRRFGDVWYPNCPKFNEHECDANKEDYCVWKGSQQFGQSRCQYKCNRQWNAPACLAMRELKKQDCKAVHKNKKTACQNDVTCKWDGKCDYDCNNLYVLNEHPKTCAPIVSCDKMDRSICDDYGDLNANKCEWYESKCMSSEEIKVEKARIQDEEEKLGRGFTDDGEYYCEGAYSYVCDKRKACRWEGGKCKHHTCSVYNWDQTECDRQRGCTYNDGACCSKWESDCRLPTSAPSFAPSSAPSSPPTIKPTTSMQPSDSPSKQPVREVECSSTPNYLCGVEGGCYLDDKNGGWGECVDDPCASKKEYNDCYMDDTCAWMVPKGEFDKGKCGSLEHAHCQNEKGIGYVQYEIWDSTKCNAKSNCYYRYSSTWQPGTPGTCLAVEDVNCIEYAESEPHCSTWYNCEWKKVENVLGCHNKTEAEAEKQCISKCLSADANYEEEGADDEKEEADDEKEEADDDDEKEEADDDYDDDDEEGTPSGTFWV